MNLQESINRLVEKAKKELEETRDRAIRDFDWTLANAKSEIEAYQNLVGELPASITDLLITSKGRFWIKAFRRDSGSCAVPSTSLRSLSLNLENFQVLFETGNPLIEEHEDFQILLAVLPLKKNPE